MLKAFLYEVWNEERTKEVLVIAKTIEESEEKLIISEDEDYEFQEELDYDVVLI